jgi:putative acetyltransferase
MGASSATPQPQGDDPKGFKQQPALTQFVRHLVLGYPGAVEGCRLSLMHIEIDDPARADVRALLDEHLRHMHELSPPESVHALDVSGLKRPDVTFWSVRDGDVLLGCGALKELGPEHGEIKSMRTPAAARRRGAGRAILNHILAEALRRGYRRLSLETGTAQAFHAAHELYLSAGFQYCGPFGDYELDPHSVFMTLELQGRVASEPERSSAGA